MTPTDHQTPYLPYAELAASSNFSFLRGASHAEELVVQAAKLGLSGISIADRNSVAGVVRAHMAAKEAGVPFTPGCRLAFTDGTSDILVWPQNRQGWANLCELLTTGKRRAPKGSCYLQLNDLLEWGAELIIAPVFPSKFEDKTCRFLSDLANRFHGKIYVALTRVYGPHDSRRLEKLADVAKTYNLPSLAIGDVLYHIPERRPLQDVLSCIREGTTLKNVGQKLEPNAERHLKSLPDTAHLFKGYEAAITATVSVFNKLNFSLDELKYQYPDDPIFEELGGHPVPSQMALEQLTARGAKQRFPEGVPTKVQAAIRHEMQLIKKLDYAPYFLTVYDIVRYARSQGILCQGRGSAANSSICYCLGITEVDPVKVDLLFERFISEARDEPPDIDVDFEHERREEVIQYIYTKYGREKAGLAATVITYRSRSALREVGKVFGLTDDAISAISGTRWGSGTQGIGDEEAKRAGLNPRDKHLQQVLDLTNQIIGFPRHLSQHVGGFVITRDRLSSLIPIENAAMDDRTIVEWDKDDLESLGMLKIDVLALGMLTCLRKAFDLLESHYGRQETLSSLPDEDTATYDMICRADTLGVFQIESRAQMSMLPRLKPRTYYDLVIEVAIVRPGPIQGDMVHPYLRRRQGKEKVAYPKPELKQVLEKTLGVPLFQEQAMNIAIVAAHFSPTEADKLRRAMATFRRVGTINNFKNKMVEGMVKNGYERDFSEHCFKQIEGFGDYGFPESHAASFALLVYVSCWLKCYYPDVFCAAILNSQPMGFYAPAQLVRDAKEHGVEILPPDINHSQWDSTLEACSVAQKIAPQHREMHGVSKHAYAVRLGLNRVKGLSENHANQLVTNRRSGYNNARDLWIRSQLPRHAVERLAEADCLRSVGMDRRKAVWAVKALDPLTSDDRLPLFKARQHADELHEPQIELPEMPLGEHVIHDYRSLSLSLKAHPVSFVRTQLDKMRYQQTKFINIRTSGSFMRIAGLVLVRQRPGTSKGVVFKTIEDEEGVANIIVWPKVFETYRAVVINAKFVGIHGKVQSAEGVTHLIAHHLEDLTPLLSAISEKIEDVKSYANADEVVRPQTDIRGKIRPPSRIKNIIEEQNQSSSYNETRKALPKGRNFH
ncbi:MAG: error-prone DNA polymerase [Hyphomicrobiales bacterium]